MKNKLNKLTLILLATLGLVGCEKGTDKTTPTQNGSSSQVQQSVYKSPSRDASYWQEKTNEELIAESTDNKSIAYQHVGSADVNRQISILLNLYEDGFVSALQCLNDGSKNYYYTGYWTNVEDDHLYVAILNYRLPTATDGYSVFCTLDYSYELKLSNNKYEFSFNACLGYANGGQYVRSVPIESEGTVEYTTEADFQTYCINYWKDKTTNDDDNNDDVDIPYTDHALLIENFTPDISTQIKAVYYSEASEWGPALGQTEYVPTESDNVILTFNTTDGKPYNIELKGNGTYTFNYSKMNISENGTWTWKSYTLTLTTANNNVFTSKIYSAS